VTVEDRPYLRSPLDGYPRGVDPATRATIDSAYRELFAGGVPATAREVAATLLAESPELDAARVLEAQADLVEGRLDETAEAMREVTRRVDDYRAALLLLGRAAEKSGRMVEAHAAYHAIESTDDAIRDAVERTVGPALDELEARVDSELANGRTSEAANAVERMRAIDSTAEPSLRAALAYGRAVGDRKIQLVAARGLAERFPGDFDLAFSRATLEVDAGDPGTGLRILQELAEAAPNDPRLADELARARFRWRLELLPEEVRSISQAQRITRAQFASLLYWLVPSVRYGAAGGGRIATDILDHPRKEEIIRVVNRGLMEVDPGLHAFSPEAPLSRLDGLEALLRLMATGGSPAGCLGGRSLGSSPSAQTVCGAAAGCGLIDADADCLPGAPVDGEWVVEAARQALNRLGI
jgi:tetratricopeptide (TPR) repeat protein